MSFVLVQVKGSSNLFFVCCNAHSPRLSTRKLSAAGVRCSIARGSDQLSKYDNHYSFNQRQYQTKPRHDTEVPLSELVIAPENSKTSLSTGC